MKNLIILFLFIASDLFGQNNIVNNGPTTWVWTNGIPTHTPSSNAAKFAVDSATYNLYAWVGSSWTNQGERIGRVSGCSSPNYTPGKGQPKIVINGCSGIYSPELWVYVGPDWYKVGGVTYVGGTGITISGDTITNTAPDRVVSIVGGGINTITGTYPNFTVTGTEVDGSVTNELQTLGLDGNNLSISNGNTITLPSQSVGLNDLTDVTIASPANNQILQYNTAGSQWVNATLSAITGTGATNKIALWSGTNIQTFNTYFGLVTQTVNGITQQIGSYSFYGQVDQYSVPYVGQGAYAKDGSGTITPVSSGFGSGIISILEPVAQGLSFYAAPAGTTNTTNIFTNNYLKFRVNKSGDVLIGASTATAGVKLEVTSTTGGVLFPRMTSTQRDAIAAPPDGLVIYNTTTAKLQVRSAGAWVDLH